MPAIEEELRQAISYRSEMAVDLAHTLLLLASEDGEYVLPTISGDGGIINGRYAQLATNIEALTAVILQRAGVPWDALAAPTEVTKQALHRRLRARGEALFAESLRESDQRETDPKALIRALREAERVAHDSDGRGRVLRSLPFYSQDLISHLVRLPKPADILRAPAQLAATLSELRNVPRWWWNLE
jgi:hypothetical protein